MPEGPEVTLLVFNLGNKIKNCKLNDIQIQSGRYLKKIPTNFLEFKKALPLNIIDIKKKGKFIWFILEKNWTIWVTLGMTGKFTIEEQKHNNIKFITSKKTLFFNDQRNFGTIAFHNSEEELEKKLKGFMT